MTRTGRPRILVTTMRQELKTFVDPKTDLYTSSPQYADALRRAAGQTEQLAALVGDDAEADDGLETIAVGLTTYAGHIEAARTGNRLGDPQAEARLRDALELTQTDLAEAVATLTDRNQERFDREVGAGLATAIIALVLGLTALVALVMTTGAFHEDGLADTADGFGGGAERARKLEIMKDSRIGTYGGVALILSLGLRWAALAILIERSSFGAAGLLIAAAALSRPLGLMPLFALPPARTDGAASTAGRPTTDAFVTALGGGAAVALFFLVVDLLDGQPLFTPSLIGSVLFHGVSAEAVATVQLDAVAYYSILHLASFAALGTAISLLVYEVELHSRHPVVVLLVLFAIIEVGFLAVASLALPGVIDRLGIVRIGAANLLAAGSIALFFLWSHAPGMRAVDAERRRAVDAK